MKETAGVSVRELPRGSNCDDVHALTTYVLPSQGFWTQSNRGRCDCVKGFAPFYADAGAFAVGWAVP